jgi:hypothetical protein
MYDSELTRPVDDALRPALQNAFDMLVDVVQQTCPDQEPNTAMTRAIAFWSTLFGMSGLIRNQLFDSIQSGAVQDWRNLIIAEARNAVLR